MRTYTHTYICTNTYTYVRTYCTNCMYLHCTKMCACTYIRTYASMCVPTCISVFRVIELETLTQVRSNLLLPLWRLLSVLMCFQYCCYARTQKHTHTHMHMYAHTYTTHMYSHTQTHTMLALYTFWFLIRTCVRTYIYNIQEQENTITSLNQQVSALEKEKLAAATSTIVRTVRMTPTHSPPTVHAHICICTYQTMS